MKPQFSLKVGTICEDSALGLDRWLTAMWLVANCKNGVSSCEIARDLGMTLKSAHRNRRALQSSSFAKLSGEVEVDESFIGGKARNMHAAKRARKITGTGGNVRAMVVDNRKKKTVRKQVHEHVEAGAAIFSDEPKLRAGRT